MAKAVATPPRVFLGEVLAQLSAKAEVSQGVLADHIGKHRAQVVRLFNGEATLTDDELSRALDLLRVNAKQQKKIRAIGADARETPSEDPYAKTVSPSMRRLAYIGANAERVLQYDKGIFPALVQCPEFIEALMEASRDILWDSDGDTAEKFAARVAFRIDRQRNTLEGPNAPTLVHLIFTEDAFYSTYGSPDVLRLQCEYMLTMLEKYRRRLVLQIVPLHTHDNPLPHVGFIWTGFDDLIDPIGFLPVAQGQSVLVNQLDRTKYLRRCFERLESLALSPTESVRMIESKMGGQR